MVAVRDRLAQQAWLRIAIGFGWLSFPFRLALVGFHFPFTWLRLAFIFLSFSSRLASVRFHFPFGWLWLAFVFNIT